MELVGRLLPLFPAFMGRRDIAVLNFGLHHGQPPDYAEALSNFSAHVSAHRAALPALYWQQTSAQHFAEAHGTGEYPGGDPPFQCVPLANVYLQRDGTLALEPGAEDPGQLLAGGWRNALADPVMRAAGVPVVHSWNESVPLWQTHRYNAKGLECTCAGRRRGGGALCCAARRGEGRGAVRWRVLRTARRSRAEASLLCGLLPPCRHSCHPSAPQTWVWNLFRALEANPPPE